MLQHDVETIDLVQAKWRVRHVQGLLSNHRTKRGPNFAWHIDKVELVDRLSHAHVDLEQELRKGQSHHTKDRVNTLPFPAL